MGRGVKVKIELITDKLLDHIFKNVDESKLSKWEVEFVKSTSVWWNQKRKLSDKQKMRLGDLWERQINAKPSRA